MESSQVTNVRNSDIIDLIMLISEIGSNVQFDNLNQLVSTNFNVKLHQISKLATLALTPVPYPRLGGFLDIQGGWLGDVALAFFGQTASKQLLDSVRALIDTEILDQVPSGQRGSYPSPSLSGLDGRMVYTSHEVETFNSIYSVSLMTNACA
jgi:hypothetical protein